MRHLLTRLPVNPAPDAYPSFNVVIAYEDFDTGKHAKRTYDLLVENIGQDWHFTNQMWKFEVLLLPKLRDIAVEDAARADVIMISSRGHDLPDHVKSWIESWLAAAYDPLALVALFGHPREAAGHRNVSRGYLADVAKRGNMEFFAQPDVWPCHFSPETVGRAWSESRFTDKALSTVLGAFQRDANTPRWSLNE